MFSELSYPTVSIYLIDSSVKFYMDYSPVGEQPNVVNIWLILPAIICLSQRLSHASLSISVYTAKLRMAHYISYNLLDRFCYLDNCRNSRANTCEKAVPGATLGGPCL